MKRKKNLKKLLNLQILDYTNITEKIGDYDIPYVCCDIVPKIDYLATYSQPSTYFYSQNTAVSFFEYDEKFDGIYGLWNGIYYGIKDIQDYYKERFENVKYFIAPDYSKAGDIPDIENMYRQFKSRVVSIWISMNLKAIVIPLVSCPNVDSMKYMLDGMDNCSIVAFNAKGPLGDLNQLKIFKKSIKYTVDRLKNLKSIIVYSSSPNKKKIYEIFEYAINSGIEIQIPDNMLQTRNRIRGDKNGIN